MWKVKASRSRQGRWGRPHLLSRDQSCGRVYTSGHIPFKLSEFALLLQSRCSRINPDTEQRSSAETKLASYATPSPRFWSYESQRNERVTRTKAKNHWRICRSKSLRIHRLQLLGLTDGCDRGRHASAQLKGAKELWSFTRIWVSLLPSAFGLCKRESGNQTGWHQGADEEKTGANNKEQKAISKLRLSRLRWFNCKLKWFLFFCFFLHIWYVLEQNKKRVM